MASSLSFGARGIAQVETKGALLRRCVGQEWRRQIFGAARGATTLPSGAPSIWTLALHWSTGLDARCVARTCSLISGSSCLLWYSHVVLNSIRVPSAVEVVGWREVDECYWIALIGGGRPIYRQPIATAEPMHHRTQPNVFWGRWPPAAVDEARRPALRS